ncbi:MAG: NAD(P)-binding protein [Galbitalea sp.]
MATAGTDTSVVVIGAGQAGLSVAFYLKRLGLDPGNEFVILDRGPRNGRARGSSAGRRFGSVPPTTSTICRA